MCQEAGGVGYKTKNIMTHVICNNKNGSETMFDSCRNHSLESDLFTEPVHRTVMKKLFWNYIEMFSIRQLANSLNGEPPLSNRAES